MKTANNKVIGKALKLPRLTRRIGVKHNSAIVSIGGQKIGTIKDFQWPELKEIQQEIQQEIQKTFLEEMNKAYRAERERMMFEMFDEPANNIRHKIHNLNQKSKSDDTIQSIRQLHENTTQSINNSQQH